MKRPPNKFEKLMAYIFVAVVFAIVIVILLGVLKGAINFFFPPYY